jgi:7,8-dihydropterin-6-yl-methyl-4-(beta-D-ribofuranosyl)aminobenzene 5'-phosphate synthase
MKMTIVYDNEVFKKGLGLKSDWGFACLIDTNHDNILFDTGANGKILIEK